MGEAEQKAVLLRQVNDGIAVFASGSLSSEPDWEFFCECGAAACQEYLSLSVAAYAAIRDNGTAVLAPGHSQPELLNVEPLDSVLRGRLRIGSAHVGRGLAAPADD